MQHGRRVVLDVGLERPFGVLLGEDAQDDVLDLDRPLEPVGAMLHPLGDRAQRGGARVVRAVDAVAEAHQPLAAVERVADPGFGRCRGLHLAELVDDLGRRAAVERSLHRADRRGHGRCDVRPGRGDDAGREGRRVEAMLGADDEVGIERPRGPSVGTGARQLVEEALGQVERRVGLDRLLAGTQSREGGEGTRRERGQGGRLLDGRWPGQILDGAPRGHGGPQRVHRLGGRRQ